jgi:hypothetical protein
MDTARQVINFYTDYENSPRYQAIEGTIGTRDGDRLIACVMNMVTAEIACDTQIAYYDHDITEFYVDMNNAQSITEEEAGYDQFGMDDFQAYLEECQCGCNTAFYSSEEGEITQIVNRPNCAGVPSMR